MAMLHITREPIASVCTMPVTGDPPTQLADSVLSIGSIYPAVSAPRSTIAILSMNGPPVTWAVACVVNIAAPDRKLIMKPIQARANILSRDA